jgi:uncharacterized protein
MIIPDVSVLVHAHNSNSTWHATARAWWERTVQGNESVGMPWISILGFLRIMTNRGAMANPMDPKRAIRQVRLWLERENVQVVGPGEQHAAILFRLLDEVGIAGNLTTDAHLAALAIEWKAEIASTDRDFGRFRGVKYFNPVERRG